MNQSHQKISISLPTNLLRYAEKYQAQQQLSSRSDVFSAALLALREKELAESYRAWTEDQRNNPDPLLTIDNTDGLELSDGSEWL
jgi:Arc/MetJ-type ribon-helix-helix transcriptional regulator